MKEYERTVSFNRDRSLITKNAVPDYYFPAVVHFLERFLGKIPPSEYLVNIFLSVLSDEKRRLFCSRIIEMDFSCFDSTELERLIKLDTFQISNAAEEISEGILLKKSKEKKTINRLMIDFFLDSFEGKTFKDPVLKKALSLKELLDISHDEAVIIYAAFISQISREIREIMFKDDWEEHYTMLSIFTDIRLTEIKRLAGNNSRLEKMGYISQEFNTPTDLKEDFKNFLRYENSELYKRSELFTEFTAGYKTCDFPIPENEIEIAEEIIKNKGPAHILFHGKPGTGKTELAKTIINESGKKGYFLKTGKSNADNSSRRHLLILGSKIAAHEDFILAVDESDSILNSEGFGIDNIKKAWIIDFMENCGAKIIWITNSINDIHPAVARRFSFNLKFENFHNFQRKKVWQNILGKSPAGNLISSSRIESLSRDFNVNAGGISTTLNTLSQLNPPQDKAEDVLRTLLKHHEVIISADKKTGGLKKITSNYNPQFLNTDSDISEVPAMINKYYSMKSDTPFTLLLQGEPGTGKTEFAKYLCETSRRTMLVKRASDLVSKYIGETEENIAKAFREAEAENAVLLLDEADSFFIDRSRAVRGWEKSQTNELLTQMENFKGVLVCCTNFLDSLDRAVMRRFTLKIKFMPPSAETLPAIFRSFFPGCPLNDIQIHRIKSFEGLTPGDFFTVKHSFSFMKENTQDTETVISELEKERSYKRTSRVAGF